MWWHGGYRWWLQMVVTDDGYRWWLHGAVPRAWLGKISFCSLGCCSESSLSSLEKVSVVTPLTYEGRRGGEGAEEAVEERRWLEIARLTSSRLASVSVCQVGASGLTRSASRSSSE